MPPEAAYAFGMICTILLLTAEARPRLFSFTSLLVVLSIIATVFNFLANIDPEEMRPAIAWLVEKGIL